MKRITLILFALGGFALAANAQEFGQGARRDLLKTETNDLPQGKAVLTGGERIFPPGGRSPWHTSGGPRLLYVLEGAMTVEGLSGQTFLTCGPAPKLCFSPPYKDPWFLRNAGQAPLKFVMVVMDPAKTPANHETVGQVTAISGERVTLAVGDLRTSELATPRREVTISVGSVPAALAVGDDVVTVSHNEKEHKAERLIKLSRRWQ